MIKSKVKEVNTIEIPDYNGELSMVEFNVGTLEGVPEFFKQCVKDLISHLDSHYGKAYLTVDGKIIKKGDSHRRGGAHIDGNYLEEICSWGNDGGGNGWKVGENGVVLKTEHHNKSYNNENGGIIMASNYATCKGWSGEFSGNPNIGGDCSHIGLNEGFTLKENAVYHGNSRFIHESLPLEKDVNRTLVRVTLPDDYNNNI